MSLSPLSDALDALRAGKPVIVVDDENRENEGDIILSAALARRSRDCALHETPVANAAKLPSPGEPACLGSEPSGLRSPRLGNRGFNRRP